MAQHFVAYSSHDAIHSKAIRSAAEKASSPEITYRPWSSIDGSASPVGRTVESWIDDCEAIVADVTYVNNNVTYEIGYGIGSQKNLRLINNSSVDQKELKDIGLLDILICNNFKTRAELEAILKSHAAPENKWPLITSQYKTAYLCAVTA
jgi:hypothetical protein